MFLFLDIFLVFLLLCDADDGSDKKTRFLRIISPSITDIAPNKKKNKCSSIICPARETSVDSNIDGWVEIIVRYRNTEIIIMSFL
jgi:hypothetical protein